MQIIPTLYCGNLFGICNGDNRQTSALLNGRHRFVHKYKLITPKHLTIEN